MDEEGHKAWLELQIDLIERIGEQAYSAEIVTFDEDGTPEFPCLGYGAHPGGCAPLFILVRPFPAGPRSR
jgi:hypothetical protein